MPPRTDDDDDDLPSENNKLNLVLSLYVIGNRNVIFREGRTVKVV